MNQIINGCLSKSEGDILIITLSIIALIASLLCLYIIIRKERRRKEKNDE